MDFMTWYQGLAKPAWTPDPATIGLVWQILYPIILVANLVFTPIQFGLRNLTLAALDILVVWATIVWMIATVLQLSITWMNRP